MYVWVGRQKTAKLEQVVQSYRLHNTLSLEPKKYDNVDSIGYI